MVILLMDTIPLRAHQLGLPEPANSYPLRPSVAFRDSAMHSFGHVQCYLSDRGKKRTKLRCDLTGGSDVLLEGQVVFVKQSAAPAVFEALTK